ncbi:hypothetical protein Z950_1656 [Sulfitobacter mediterraneus KCTC 32188]|nr:hypothetical protein Z950_1656 [Sulfitobacter mediterraneus KCTC 32188]
MQFAKSTIWQRPNRPVLPKANLRFDGAGALLPALGSGAVAL